MSRYLRFFQLVTVSLLATVGGCSRPTAQRGPLPVTCAPPMTPHLRTQVYFDRANATAPPYNTYSPAEWDKFVTEVLIRFIPAGGNLYDNTGWWRRPNGTTFRGIGRTMQVWAPVADSMSHRAAVDSVISQIKQRYKHRVVFREEERVCEAAQ
jgi:hypothetical protein